MKKVNFLFLLLLGVGLIFFNSCSTIQVPKFTSVENLYQLEMNSSLDQVIAKLGSKPYNILSSQLDGYTIYVYKYKVVERKINPSLIDNRGGETTGQEVYNSKENEVFLFFKEDQLQSFVTTEGRGDSPVLVMLNNTLYAISKYNELYIIDPTKIEEIKEEVGPFMNKKGKK